MADQIGTDESPAVVVPSGNKVGRKPLGSCRMVADSYQVDPDKLQALKELAENRGSSKAALIRDGIDWVLVNK